MYTSAIILSLAAALNVASAYPVKADLHCRSGPGTSFSVVKTYKLGHQVSITCQTPGTVIKGDELWDKTSDGCYVADWYVKTGTSNYVAPKCGGGGGGSKNLPGLNPTQSKHAQAIINEAKKENLGRQGCAAGIATAIVEVGLRS